MSRIFCSYSQHINWLSGLSPLQKDIGVYYFDISEFEFPHNKLMNFLNDDEYKRTGKYYHDSDARLFVTGRVGTKLLMAYHHNCAVSEVEIHPAENNKPYATCGTAKLKFQFNISHSGNVVIIAICESITGIDIEREYKNYKSIIESCFSDKEIIAIKKSANSAFEFTKLWTRKEAILKATGQGLIEDLKEIPVSDEINTTSILEGKNYYIHSFPIQDTYICSLCYIIAGTDIMYYKPDISALINTVKL